MASKERDATIRFLLEDGARIMLLLLLTLAVVIFLAHGFGAVFHRYTLGYGEAPLVDQAMRLADGQNIYRPDISAPPYTICNYPPLYVLSMAPFVKLFGPSYLAGRVISLSSCLASGAFLALIIYTFSRDRTAAVVTAMLFLAMPYVVGWSSAARVDMLALALSTAGLYVLVRWPATSKGLVVLALLLVAAVYTRQSSGLAAPLAAFVWLWTRDRRQALRLMALVGGTGLALFLALNALTQGGFFFNIVTANVNEFGIERLKQHWRDLRETALILLVLGGVFLFLGPRRVRSWPLLAPYLVGTALSALTSGKIGSSVNYLLELCAALSLVVGALVAWSRERRGNYARWLRAALLILLVLQVGRLMRDTLEGPVEWLKWRRSSTEDLEYLERLVQTADGPVLADEYMGLITRQRRPLYIQPFVVTQLANAGLWDQTTVLDGIRDQEFPIILIHHFKERPVYKERWTPEMVSAIMEHYVSTDFLADSVVFQPRDVAEVGLASLEACPGAPWRLPTRGDLGMWWRSRQLIVLGEGYEDTVPVYAVADGLLTRHPDWDDAVAVQHDDPVRPGEKAWSFYGDMASYWGDESFVALDFPPGSAGMPVKRGQVLGYQGTWDGRPGRPMWVHLRFAVVPALEDGSFPAEIVGLALDGESSSVTAGPRLALDPSPYLGTIRSRVMGAPDWLWLPWRCQESTP